MIIVSGKLGSKNISTTSRTGSGSANLSNQSKHASGKTHITRSSSVGVLNQVSFVMYTKKNTEKIKFALNKNCDNLYRAIRNQMLV